MKCRDAHELITAYIDNGIDPANDRLLQEHLSACDKCRAELKFLMAYKKSLKAINPVKAPPGFMAGLRKRLKAETRSPFTKYLEALVEFKNSLRFPVEAAALVIIGSVIFVLYRPDRLIMPRMTAPVTEYSDIITVQEPVQKDKGAASVNDRVNLKVHDRRSFKDERAVTAEKIYSHEKEKAEYTDTADLSDAAGGTGGSAGTGELSSTADRESDLYLMEKRAAEKKDTGRSESRVMGKQRLNAADNTPEDLCRRYNAEILKTESLDNGVYRYTIKVRESGADDLLALLSRNFTVALKSKETRDGLTTLVLEIKK